MPTKEDTLFSFSLLSTSDKKFTAAFNRGLISSDGGVLWAGVDKRLGLISMYGRDAWALALHEV